MNALAALNPGTRDKVAAVLLHIADEQPHAFSARQLAIATGPRTGEHDDRRIFMLMEWAEHRGLAARSRARLSNPWLWALTTEGRRAAEQERAAGQ